MGIGRLRADDSPLADRAPASTRWRRAQRPFERSVKSPTRIDLPQHVLRFWETRFPQIRPLKRAGGRRYYRPDDVDRLRLIKRLLYDEGYTIKGVQKLFKEQGVQALTGADFEPRLAFAAAEPLARAAGGEAADRRARRRRPSRLRSRSRPPLRPGQGRPCPTNWRRCAAPSPSSSRRPASSSLRARARDEHSIGDALPSSAAFPITAVRRSVAQPG